MLSDLQRRVATLFLSLPETDGFALAGGAALIVQQVVVRDTRDLDLFVHDLSAVRAASDAFVARATTNGWTVEVLRSGPAFSKLLVGDGTDSVQMELGYDYRWLPADDSDLGPVLSIAELGVDKLLALFGRAEARDFVDVFHLAELLGIGTMVDNASQKDPGFDPYHLAVNLDLMDRHARDAFQVEDDTLTAMREFFDALRADLIDRTLAGPDKR
ncbi:hypothetical protein BH23ACT9_BH23ACT9_22390 [soil metagenome]